MIICKEGYFHLRGSVSSYIFRITDYGHLEQVYYGEAMPSDVCLRPLELKRTAVYGSSVLYDRSDPVYCLDQLPLEWSGQGRGDYRASPMEISLPDGSYVADLKYQSCQQGKGILSMRGDLPQAHSCLGQSESTAAPSREPEHLIIKMRDSLFDLELQIIYTLFADTDVITRRTMLVNQTGSNLHLRRLMSLMLDLPDRGFSLTTLHGGWIREGQRQSQPLFPGQTVRESTTGNSSNRHNPAFALAEAGADELKGRVYGFNLIYSGNHYELIEKTETGLVRLMTGISPSCFDWQLADGESFESPEAVMTFSQDGFNGMSANFHDFIHRYIIPPFWHDRSRPVLINSWEAFYFKFDQPGLLRLARQAKDLGIELFVLDDGWFGGRDHDRAGLGDYKVNHKKLPGGLDGFGRKLEKTGLKFGLWVEPEMVNEDSDLYRAHPEYAVKIPGREPVLGRNQLVLDLCRPQVRDYIVESISAILDQAPVSYVKWDMNRHISDMFSGALSNQGEFYHRYCLGLYDVLRRIFAGRPQILLESCSSGGNRFDLGMLCFSPQIWTSDNNDPIERQQIQSGMSLFYPQSAMGAHVAASPHSQTLRHTSLATRFHTAAFGCLGYELNLNHLDRLDKKEIREQVEFYKKYRQTLQFGRFYRLPAVKANQTHWLVVNQDKTQAVAGFFQQQARAAEGFDRLPLTGLDPLKQYKLSTRPLRLQINRFGGLVNHLLPVRIKPGNPLLRLAGRFYTLPDSTETYIGSGRQLHAGVMLNNQFIGTGYNSDIRMLGDFGSHIYLIEENEYGGNVNGQQN